MASNNNIKDQVLLLFPDNNSNEITAADMRLYVEAVFGDKEVQIKKIQKLSDLASENSTIYEGSLVIVYGDPNQDKIGIYLSKVNQPTTESNLIQISSKGGGSVSPSNPERGGISFDVNTTYFVGDIVAYDNGTSLDAYIAINDSPIPASSFIPSDWKLLNASEAVTGTLDRNFGKLNAGTDVTGFTPKELIEQGFIGEIVSSISISSPSNLTLEKGNTQNNVEINYSIVDGTGTLIKVEFSTNSSIIGTLTPPISRNGTYLVGTISDTTTFSAKVTDTIGTNNSNNRSYTFVYPYYFGTDAQGISSVTNLTKDIRRRDTNETKTFTTNNNVFYYCYLKSYGNLTSILDENGFETLSDWTRRDVNVTGLDTSTQVYSFYEFNNVTSTTTQFTFKI